MNKKEIVQKILEIMILLISPYFSLIRFITINLKPKILLYKLTKYEGRLILESPFFEKIKNGEFKKETNFKIAQILLPFVKKLKNYTSEENLNIVYNNLKSLKI